MSEPTQYRRSRPPCDYLWEIKSFDELKKLYRCESGIFEAAGRKWSLILYPKGDKKNGGSGYISLYLSIETTNRADPGWNVEVDCKLFVHDKNNNNYLTIQDADGQLKRFDRGQTRWGYSRLLSLAKFENSGFSKSRSCTFGAEVFRKQGTRRVESLTMRPNPSITCNRMSFGTFPWEINNFTNKESDSITFAVGRRNWKLKMAKSQGSLSVDLKLLNLSANRKLYAHFKLTVLSQQSKKFEPKMDPRWINASNLTWHYSAPLKDVQKKRDHDVVKVLLQFLAISIAEDIPTGR